MFALHYTTIPFWLIKAANGRKKTPINITQFQIAQEEDNYERRDHHVLKYAYIER